MLLAMPTTCKFYHTIALGVGHMVSKYHPAIRVVMALHQFGHAGAVKDIVAQNERHFIVTDKLFTYQESLGQPFGALLHSIGERAAQAGAVSQQLLKIGQVGGACSLPG